MELQITEPIEHRLKDLAGEIQTWSNQHARNTAEISQLESQIKEFDRQETHFRILLFIKSPSKSVELFSTIVCLTATLAVGLAAFILGHLISGSFISATCAGGFFALASLLFCIFLFFATPTLSHIDNWLAYCEISKTNLRDKLSEVSQADFRTKSYIETLSNQRRALQASLEQKKREQYASSERARLLNSNWRELRGVPFEEFLERVFRSLGFKVECTKTTGDQGIDLVVEKGHLRIAIQAKGYEGSVGNSAVQQAVAGVRVYRCNCCAVIINSKFTKAARELAQANECVLVSAKNFRDFINGNVHPFQ